MKFKHFVNENLTEKRFIDNFKEKFLFYFNNNELYNNKFKKHIDKRIYSFFIDLKKHYKNMREPGWKDKYNLTEHDN